jgi:hypothetical protein
MPSSFRQRQFRYNEHPRSLTTRSASRTRSSTTNNELEQFVARTTTRSGVPVLVEDLGVIEQIARVLARAPAADNTPHSPSDAHARRVAVSRVVS